MDLHLATPAQLMPAIPVVHHGRHRQGPGYNARCSPLAHAPGGYYAAGAETAQQGMQGTPQARGSGAGRGWPQAQGRQEA